MLILNHSCLEWQVGSPLKNRNIYILRVQHRTMALIQSVGDRSQNGEEAEKGGRQDEEQVPQSGKGSTLSQHIKQSN